MLSARASRTSVRLVASAAAATIALSLAAPTVASAAPGQDAGLFGSADPTYDGAFRQSIAIIGLTSAKAPVPASAVAWLVAQQCADGAFQAYRPDPSTPCSAPDPAAFSGPDSNSTALAAMALRTAGRPAQSTRAVTALISSQNSDGGWGYTLGGTSDVNSTGLALAAVNGAARTASTGRALNRAITRATAYLVKAQAPCTASRATRFGLPYQPGQAIDVLATGQGLIGVAGTLPYQRVAARGVAGTGCRDSLARQLSSYLARVLLTTKGRVPSALDPSKTDWNATATAVVALGSAGAAPAAQAVGITALGANTADYLGTGPTASPAAAGTLIQAAVGAGARPRSFGTGRVNLVSVLLGTLRK